jgi:hypothetical protein
MECQSHAVESSIAQVASVWVNGFNPWEWCFNRTNSPNFCSSLSFIFLWVPRSDGLCRNPWGRVNGKLWPAPTICLDS